MCLSVFGDSILKGVILEDGKYICRAEERQQLERRYGIDADNCCKFGATIDKGIEFARRKIRAGKVGNRALIEFGGNDSDFDWASIAADPTGEHACKTSLERFAGEYRELIHELREAGCEPMAATLPPISSERYFRWFCRDGLDGSSVLQWLGDINAIYRWQEQFSRCVERVALEEHCRIVDLRSAFLEDPRALGQLLCEDGIHPNRTGQELIYREIGKAMSA